MKSCAHWLNWQCGIDLGAAREKVRAARALEHLPRLAAAMAEGRISYAKVRAVTRVADARNEDYFLNIALHGTASHVEALDLDLALASLVQRREKNVSAETSPAPPGR